MAFGVVHACVLSVGSGNYHRSQCWPSMGTHWPGIQRLGGADILAEQEDRAGTVSKKMGVQELPWPMQRSSLPDAAAALTAATTSSTLLGARMRPGAVGSKVCIVFCAAQTLVRTNSMHIWLRILRRETKRFLRRELRENMEADGRLGAGTS